MKALDMTVKHAFATLTISVFVTAGYLCLRPALPVDIVKRLENGMTQQRVRDLIGTPKSIDSDGTWIYSRWCNPGWIEVRFDIDGYVSDVNDESVIPIR